ncbi:Uncharacterised protein [Candidatus Gugararchaeum adminiculabundum]|nr:Uncharacterised protein [Candidatus Gugararchaeum adminiculabundum]
MRSRLAFLLLFVLVFSLGCLGSNQAIQPEKETVASVSSLDTNHDGIQDKFTYIFKPHSFDDGKFTITRLVILKQIITPGTVTYLKSANISIKQPAIASIRAQVFTFNSSRQPAETDCDRLTGLGQNPCYDQESCLNACNSQICRQYAIGVGEPFINWMEDYSTARRNLDNALTEFDANSKGFIDQYGVQDDEAVKRAFTNLDTAEAQAILINENELFNKQAQGLCDPIAMNISALRKAREELSAASGIMVEKSPDKVDTDITVMLQLVGKSQGVSYSESKVSEKIPESLATNSKSVVFKTEYSEVTEKPVIAIFSSSDVASVDINRTIIYSVRTSELITREWLEANYQSPEIEFRTASVSSIPFISGFVAFVQSVYSVFYSFGRFYVALALTLAFFFILLIRMAYNFLKLITISLMVLVKKEVFQVRLKEFAGKARGDNHLYVALGIILIAIGYGLIASSAQPLTVSSSLTFETLSKNITADPVKSCASFLFLFGVLSLYFVIEDVFKGLVVGKRYYMTVKDRMFEVLGARFNDLERLKGELSQLLDQSQEFHIDVTEERRLLFATPIERLRKKIATGEDMQETEQSIDALIANFESIIAKLKEEAKEIELHKQDWMTYVSAIATTRPRVNEEMLVDIPWKWRRWVIERYVGERPELGLMIDSGAIVKQEARHLTGQFETREEHQAALAKLVLLRFDGLKRSMEELDALIKQATEAHLDVSEERKQFFEIPASRLQRDLETGEDLDSTKALLDNAISTIDLGLGHLREKLNTVSQNRELWRQHVSNLLARGSRVTTEMLVEIPQQWRMWVLERYVAENPDAGSIQGGVLMRADFEKSAAETQTTDMHEKDMMQAAQSAATRGELQSKLNELKRMKDEYESLMHDCINTHIEVGEERKQYYGMPIGRLERMIASGQNYSDATALMNSTIAGLDTSMAPLREKLAMVKENKGEWETYIGKVLTSIPHAGEETLVNIPARWRRWAIERFVADHAAEGWIIESGAITKPLRAPAAKAAPAISEKKVSASEVKSLFDNLISKKTEFEKKLAEAASLRIDVTDERKIFYSIPIARLQKSVAAGQSTAILKKSLNKALSTTETAIAPLTEKLGTLREGKPRWMKSIAALLAKSGKVKEELAVDIPARWRKWAIETYFAEHSQEGLTLENNTLMAREALEQERAKALEIQDLKRQDKMLAKLNAKQDELKKSLDEISKSIDACTELSIDFTEEKRRFLSIPMVRIQRMLDEKEDLENAANMQQNAIVDADSVAAVLSEKVTMVNDHRADWDKFITALFQKNPQVTQEMLVNVPAKWRKWAIETYASEHAEQQITLEDGVLVKQELTSASENEVGQKIHELDEMHAEFEKLLKQARQLFIDSREEAKAMYAVPTERIEKLVKKKDFAAALSLAENALSQAESGLGQLNEKVFLVNDGKPKWDKYISSMISKSDRVPEEALVDIPSQWRKWAIERYVAENSDKGLTLEGGAILTAPALEKSKKQHQKKASNEKYALEKRISELESGLQQAQMEKGEAQGALKEKEELEARLAQAEENINQAIQTAAEAIPTAPSAGRKKIMPEPMPEEEVAQEKKPAKPAPKAKPAVGKKKPLAPAPTEEEAAPAAEAEEAAPAKAPPTSSVGKDFLEARYGVLKANIEEFEKLSNNATSLGVDVMKESQQLFAISLDDVDNKITEQDYDEAWRLIEDAIKISEDCVTRINVKLRKARGI